MTTSGSSESVCSVKSTSSVHDIATDKPPFGSRFLTDEAEVWTQNAWDHVPPPDDQADLIQTSLTKQRSTPVPEHERVKYNEKPSRHWDNFYKTNANNFFRDRKWLRNEFPELMAAARPEAGRMKLVELGCGAGNALFPLITANQNPQLELHAYDYSSHAIKLVQNNPLYLYPSTGSIHASVWDLTSPNGLPKGLVPGTVDIVTLVFVLSALHPGEWGRAIANIYHMLKPGGLVLLRDYGRHDLTQLRFKAGRMLEDNFYIRGDKTRVYFFELDELSYMFTGSPCSSATTRLTEITETISEGENTSNSLTSARLSKRSSALLLNSGLSANYKSTLPPDTPLPDLMVTDLTSIPPLPDSSSSILNTTSTATSVHPRLLSPFPECPPHPLFATEQLGVDRRLLVNRKRQLKMYRVWMQGKFRKLT